MNNNSYFFIQVLDYENTLLVFILNKSGVTNGVTIRKRRL